VKPGPADGGKQAGHGSEDAALWKKGLCLSKKKKGLLSRPTINPPCTCGPALWMRLIDACRLRLLFCTLPLSVWLIRLESQYRYRPYRTLS
jgi:hypothetical protein